MNGVKVDAEKKVTNPSSHTLYAHWSTEEETEAADGSEIPDEAEPERELTEIQGICLTVSLVFILAAVISVIAKKKA